MLIQVNTDGHVAAERGLTERVERVLRDALDRLAPRLTRVEVHLSDDNGQTRTGGADKRCLLEARLAGLQPITVSDLAPTLEQALDGAARKLVRALESTLGRMEGR